MRIQRIGQVAIAVSIALALVGCSPQPQPSSTATTMPTETQAASPTPSATQVPTPSASPTPSVADVDGTWCRAADPTSCETFTDGRTADGAMVRAADTDDGAPCLTVAVSDDGGGFVLFYCPAGISPDVDVVTDDSAGADMDDDAYDRLFATQNPPYVDTWYRASDVAAAIAD